MKTLIVATLRGGNYENHGLSICLDLCSDALENTPTWWRALVSSSSQAARFARNCKAELLHTEDWDGSLFGGMVKSEKPGELIISPTCELYVHSENLPKKWMVK